MEHAWAEIKRTLSLSTSIRQGCLREYSLSSMGIGHVTNEPMGMGPVIYSKAKQFILDRIEAGIEEGAHPILDDRNLVVKGYKKGHFIGPTVFSDVKPGMKIHEGVPRPTERYWPEEGLKAGSPEKRCQVLPKK